MPSNDSLKTRQDLSVGRKKYAYYSLPAAEEAGLAGISRLPRSMKVLLENLLRNEDGVSVTEADLRAVAAWIDNKGAVEHEISLPPGPGPDAGLHRRPRRGRPGRHARRHDPPRRQPREDQSAECPSTW